MDGTGSGREVVPGPVFGGIGHAALVEDGGVVGEAAGIGAVGHAGHVAVGVVHGGGDHGLGDGGGVDGAISDVIVQGGDGVVVGGPVVAHLEHVGQIVGSHLGLELRPVAAAVVVLVLDLQAGERFVHLNDLDGDARTGIGAPPHDAQGLAVVIGVHIAFGVDVVPALGLGLVSHGRHSQHRRQHGQHKKKSNQGLFHEMFPPLEFCVDSATAENQSMMSLYAFQ